MLSDEIREFLALCVLASLGLVLVGGIVLKLRRSPFSPVQSLLYALNYLVVRVLWRVHISGSLAIPPRQGAVVI